jgi:hypothetical protein
MNDASADLTSNPAFGLVDVARWVYVAETDAKATEESEAGIVKHIFGRCQSNANQPPNIKMMRISRRRLTPFGHGRSAVLLECFAWG